ncbi:MAG: hypothetical protein AAFN13_02635 [Bacteroidota bacterium]|mgnify:FL=1
MSKLTPGRAVGLWIAYVLIFAIAGGLAAGVLALVYDAVIDNFDNTLYAIVYGVTGFMAYRLARSVMEDGR